MKTRSTRLALALLALALAPATAGAEPVVGSGAPIHGYRAADPGAPAVTAENLLANERFWPYVVALTASYRPEGRDAALSAGSRGLLVRVEAPGDAMRIDFTRDGRYRVPVSATDVVERANRVRLGELNKIAPNLVLEIGPRLVDTEAEEPRFLEFETTLEPPGFLAVFADPGEPRFEELAKALAPLRDRHGVMTVLLPQGRHPDPETRERLRKLGWPVPFVLGNHAEGYARSRLEEGTRLPAVMLMTPDGRVVYGSPWAPSVVPDLTRALDAQFGAAPLVGAAGAGPQSTRRADGGIETR